MTPHLQGGRPGTSDSSDPHPPTVPSVVPLHPPTLSLCLTRVSPSVSVYPLTPVSPSVSPLTTPALSPCLPFYLCPLLPSFSLRVRPLFPIPPSLLGVASVCLCLPRCLCVSLCLCVSPSTSVSGSGSTFTPVSAPPYPSVSEGTSTDVLLRVPKGRHGNYSVNTGN